MARTGTIIRHMHTKLRRRIRTDRVVKYGLCLTVFIFAVFLLGLVKSPGTFFEAGEGSERDGGHGREVRESGESGNNVLPVPEQEPLAPLVGPGEMGEPVNITKEMLSDEDGILFEELFTRNSFNQYASDMISLKRKLPDMRSEECKAEKYHANLPDTTVIVCFHNEAWSTLMRSMHSILDRTPSHLLTEIILVDDASTQQHLKEKLTAYVARYPKVKLVRSKERIGLIKGRLLGYRHATGTVLTFLDSHIECTIGWVEPLLDRIARSTSNVVWPVIDGINAKTFEYKSGGPGTFGTQVGGFDWGLQFNWHLIPERDNKTRKHPTAPVRSPTMAGGLFSIDRKYFEYLGTYDDDMDIWGGENLELSFKTWMCGGILEMIPCSRVGHIFREKSPYKWRDGKDVLKKNLVRLAEVWMDDYKKYYYERINNDTGNYGDISERLALRKRLNCTSFQWYIDNIFPDIFIPDKAQAWGEIKNEAYDGKYCMDAVEEKGSNRTVDVWPCHGQGGNQFFSFSNISEIRRDDNCVDYATTKVVLFPCHASKGNQLWIHDLETKTFRNPPADQCLELDIDRLTIVPERCNASKPEQQWTFAHYADSTVNLTITKNSTDS